jgi:hypothetical protein
MTVLAKSNLRCDAGEKSHPALSMEAFRNILALRWIHRRSHRFARFVAPIADICPIPFSPSWFRQQFMLIFRD